MSKINEARKEIESLISDYATVRIKFKDVQKSHPEYLEGNDNYIGIIGEYWAKIFLETLPQNTGLKIVNSSSEGNKSEKWVDFKIKKDNIQEDINVKAISSENKKLESGTIKLKDRNKENICSILIVKLNDELFPEQLLYIRDIDTNLINRDYIKYRSKPQNNIYFKYDANIGFEEVYNNQIYIYEDNKFIQKVKS